MSSVMKLRKAPSAVLRENGLAVADEGGTSEKYNANIRNSAAASSRRSLSSWNTCLRNCGGAANQPRTQRSAVFRSFFFCALLALIVVLFSGGIAIGPSPRSGTAWPPVAIVFASAQGSATSREESPPALPLAPAFEARYQRAKGAPNYGDINYARAVPHVSSGWGRVIPDDDDHRYELHRHQLLEDVDDDVYLEYYSKEDLEDQVQKCRDVEWVGKHRPTCNTIHEVIVERPNDMSYDQNHDATFLRSGTYRDAWRLKRRDILDDDFVVKRFILTDREWDAGDMFKIHREASIMEQLASSTRILNIYGFCGTTVHVATMAGDIDTKIIYGEGLASQAELDKLDDVYPLNNLTISEKLQISLTMAESLADIHGYKGGVIYHADTHIEQWLVAPDGSIKLNDFNNAKIMKWDERHNRYCHNQLHYGGTYRSPEEFDVTPQDESVDTFAYGNNIYTMLVGLWPFYDMEFRDIGSRKIQKYIIDGQLPFVDERYRTRSYIERQLIYVMEKCWAYEPDKRPPMSEVASFLRKVKAKAKTKGELEESHWIKIA